MKTSRLLLVLVASLSVSTGVLARGNGDDCNGRGSCAPAGGGDSSANAAAGAIGVGVGVGVGMGGAGGAGGAGGHATGGSVIGSGNSANHNANTNNIGNASGFGSKTFSPEAHATIEKGAVTNTNVVGVDTDIRNTNTNNNANISSNKNEQGQAQGQHQGQAQGQSQSTKNSGNNTGVSNVTFNEASGVHYSGEYKVKNVAPVSIGGPASGPCNGFSGGIGMSAPGWAIGANASTVDYGCEQREAARVAGMLGRMDIANAILEDMEVVKNALKNREGAQKKAEATVLEQKLATTKPVYRNAAGEIVKYEGTDETVIRRLGLTRVNEQQVAAQ